MSLTSRTVNSAESASDQESSGGCIHLIKLCVGAASFESLAEWQAARIQSGAFEMPEHVTRMRPKRAAEILSGGSLYWVIQGFILARQRILAFEPREGADRIIRCAIIMDRRIIRTRAVPRRPFQGWRYLTPEAAPPDVGISVAGDDVLPREIAAQLDRFGVIHGPASASRSRNFPTRSSHCGGSGRIRD